MHRIKHNKGKECVAAKGAKLSSWLLPHSILQVGGGYTVLLLIIIIIKLFRLNNEINRTK